MAGSKPFEFANGGGDSVVLRWPESGNWACDGEYLTRDDMRALRDALTEALGDVHGAEATPVAEVRNGDKVVFCFGDVDLDADEADRTLSVLRKRMQGIEFGIVVGVTGVLIQRGTDNDPGRTDDDA